jgi:hypothetical protein
MIDVGRDFERMRGYVAGRLSEDETRSFEDRLARDPSLVQELEQWLRLREGLEHLRDKGYFNAVAARSLKPRAAWLPGALAAGIAAVAAVVWLRPHSGAPALLSATLPVSHGAAPTANVTAHFTFITMRGQETPDLNLPGDGLIELRARPVAGGSGSFRMELSRASDGTTPAPLAAISAQRSEDGYLHAYADAARLQPGKYLLRVAPQSATPAAAASFYFNLQRAPAAP